MVCGGWHAGEWNWPPGTVQTLASVTNSNTPGAVHGPLSPPVPRRARAARVRLQAWHTSFPGGNSSLKLFSNWFFSKFSN
jgi:hypothetical protein